MYGCASFLLCFVTMVPEIAPGPLHHKGPLALNVGWQLVGLCTLRSRKFLDDDYFFLFGYGSLNFLINGMFAYPLFMKFPFWRINI